MSRKAPHHRLPPPKIDAAPQGRITGRQNQNPVKNERRASGGRRPLFAQEARLIAVLNNKLAEKGISHRQAGRLASVDPADACRVLAFGETTPRTLRRLFEKFRVNEYKRLSARDRRVALLLEIRAAVERQAELLGELAALNTAENPPGI